MRCTFVYKRAVTARALSIGLLLVWSPTVFAQEQGSSADTDRLSSIYFALHQNFENLRSLDIQSSEKWVVLHKPDLPPASARIEGRPATMLSILRYEDFVDERTISFKTEASKFIMDFEFTNQLTGGEPQRNIYAFNDSQYQDYHAPSRRLKKQKEPLAPANVPYKQIPSFLRLFEFTRSGATESTTLDSLRSPEIWSKLVDTSSILASDVVVEDYNCIVVERKLPSDFFPGGEIARDLLYLAESHGYYPVRIERFFGDELEPRRRITASEIQRLESESGDVFYVHGKHLSENFLSGETFRMNSWTEVKIELDKIRFNEDIPDGEFTIPLTIVSALIDQDVAEKGFRLPMPGEGLDGLLEESSVDIDSSVPAE